MNTYLSESEKIWISEFCIVTLHLQTDEKTTDSLIIHRYYSAFFDLLIPQKVRQVGLSETSTILSA